MEYDPVQDLQEFLQHKTKSRLELEPAITNWNEDDLRGVLDFIWKQDWPPAKKAFHVGFVMFSCGLAAMQDSIHPVALDMIKTLESLDDQGIDIEGAMVSLVPRQGPPRPEQMAKWPAIFKLN